jgi:Uma2 family endonuclease
MVTGRGGDVVAVRRAAEIVLGHDGPWTWDDLEELPETARWFEIVDGSLIVVAPPTTVHQVVVTELAMLLHQTAPDTVRVLAGGGVQYGLTVRMPDVLVIRRGPLRPGPLEPADVLLAVEVQSPSTQTTDRVTKAYEYAAQGIPAYWRVELEPEPTLRVYALQDGVYAEAAVARGPARYRARDPYPVEISPADLVR